MRFHFTRAVLLSLSGALLLVGAGIGWLLHGRFAAASTPTIFREPEGKYHFISPLIAFSVGEKSEFTEYANLERLLRDKISALKRAGKIHSTSVYFRDMQSGHWTGVNEEELYSPASLYKVALMIAVLQVAENEPTLLNERIPFKGSPSAEAPDNPPMEVGRSYAMRELMERLITLSDNDAKDMLRNRIGAGAVSAVFADFRLAEPALNEVGDTMSARTYSRFFRALYNATYLSRASSEYALELLSRVEFKSGIVNGLTQEARALPVAHKFGYRVFKDPTDEVTEEIHDCGIIYVPTRPYFICVMTKGSQETDLLDTIQLLSRAVYEEVAKVPASE